MVVKHSKLLRVNLSGNYFDAVPENLFDDHLALEEVTWERDICDKSRSFPENFFAKNTKLKYFRYSKDDACPKLILPPNFFSLNETNLVELKLTNSGLVWNDVGPILPALDKLQVLYLTHNRMENVSLQDLPNQRVQIYLDNNTDLNCM